jgi:LPXTG-motif cell wall-anchored protein
LAERLGDISGQVVNGTAGAAPPAGLEVNLHSFDEQSLVETLTTTTAADGSFAFDAVAYRLGRQFLVSAVYGDVTYGSEVAAFGAAGEPLALTLPVYETTNDPAALVVEQMHMFLEFVNPGTVTVGQLYVFANTSDKTYAADGAGLLQFNLPAEAANLDVQNAILDQDYFRNADGFGALVQVQPGEVGGQILFSFQLPYSDALSFSQVMHYPVDTVNLLVSDLGVDLTGPNLQNLGQETFQGQSFQNLVQIGLGSGEALTFEMTGAPNTAGSGGAPAVATGDSTSLAIGLAGLAGALLGIGYWLYRRPARPDPAALREDLLQAIAELDDAYAAGEVARDDYAAERAQLKADLVKVWDAADD